ncbi:hypothetical protein KCM76_24945 [Zooshikella marina]|uniref:hypothetical protein n=1 Tax=Zooshikella ganghwensis TaxID=202772 RepID=UPI001BAFA8FA|nr:hypothetical protein [Zooshikella ganghwensis]MBU2709267.1 hypothetical protein [Zooshikella ganghwensis]
MPFEVGTKVKLISTGEVGVVIHVWKNRELDVFDYHVAFYGAKFPESEPAELPYVLRYLESSLVKVNE